MADLKAEQIMQAVETTVTNLPTTGARVYRGRVNPLAEGIDSALSVYEGDDIEQSVLFNVSYWVLTIYIECHARSTTEDIETLLNQIRKEATIAMLATSNLGLAFVADVREANAERPELSGEGEQVTGTRVLVFEARYRRQTNDPSA